MAVWYPDNGDVPDFLVIVDPERRRFYFDDRLLPDLLDPSRDDVRDLIGGYARARLDDEGVTGMPNGNLLDVTPNLAGWRGV